MIQAVIVLSQRLSLEESSGFSFSSRAGVRHDAAVSQHVESRESSHGCIERESCLRPAFAETFQCAGGYQPLFSALCAKLARDGWAGGFSKVQPLRR